MLIWCDTILEQIEHFVRCYPGIDSQNASEEKIRQSFAVFDEIRAMVCPRPDASMFSKIIYRVRLTLLKVKLGLFLDSARNSHPFPDTQIIDDFFELISRIEERPVDQYLKNLFGMILVVSEKIPFGQKVFVLKNLLSDDRATVEKKASQGLLEAFYRRPLEELAGPLPVISGGRLPRFDLDSPFASEEFDSSSSSSSLLLTNAKKVVSFDPSLADEVTQVDNLLF